MVASAWESGAWVVIAAEPDRVVLRVCGDLDMESCPTIEPAVLAAVVSAPAVTFDLAGLRFCNSTGIAMFIAAYEKARAEGTTIELRGTPPNVRRVFKIAGLDTVMPFID
jgi:anti-sigma B factor antagonist